jgi:TetR/AcrR family transcriptional regulator, mexJK operon transcriptional repressor
VPARTASRRPSESSGPTGPRAEANRAAILVAARRCFVDEGFTANLDRVAERADVSKVTIYNHFGSKEALCLAVVDDAVSGALEDAIYLVESQLGASSDVRSDLTAACRVWVAGLATRDMLSLRNAVVGEVGRTPRLAAEWSRRGPERFNRVIGSALGRLVKTGQLRIPDIDLAVLQLSGLVLSPALVYGSYGKPPSPKNRERLIVAGVDMFLAYYGTGKK